MRHESARPPQGPIRSAAHSPLLSGGVAATQREASRASSQSSAGHSFGKFRTELRSLRHWPWIKRGAAIAFLLLVGMLVTIEARKVHWHEVFAAIRAMPAATLLAALALAACSHALYGSFDLMGRSYTDHRLPTPTVLAVTFISYAFNLNLGTLIGGAGVRFRLYTQYGLGLDKITRVVTLAMLTNWMGYLLLGGVELMLQPITLQVRWLRDAGAHWLIGGMLVLVPIAYVVACGWSPTRVLQLRSHRLKLPSLRLSLLQVALSSANWMVMAALVWTLMQGRIDYPAVLFALLAAAVSGVIMHVPGGLGVIEAVFVALLSDRLATEEIIAALLAYRALYYLLPLAIAAAMYFVLEMRARRRKAEQRRA